MYLNHLKTKAVKLRNWGLGTKTVSLGGNLRKGGYQLLETRVGGFRVLRKSTLMLLVRGGIKIVITKIG